MSVVSTRGKATLECDPPPRGAARGGRADMGATYRVGASRSWVDRLESVPSRRFAVVAASVFILVAVRVYWPQWPVTGHTIVGCACGDEVQEVWFLKWTPWSILHGLNPLSSNWMDYPQGFNLAANTSMPALGLLAAPVTALAGAVASYNLLMWASFPLSAFSAYWVLRRVSGSNLAALLGGLLYGYSPYMVDQGVAHLFLVFVPLPPLILYCLYRIVAVQEGSARRWGLRLAGLFIVQVLISQEVAAEALIVATIALIVSMVVFRTEITSARVNYAIRALATAAGGALVVLVYPVYFEFLGPRHVSAAAHATTHGLFNVDLLGTVVPTSHQYVAPGWLARIGDRFMGGDTGEDGAYLGLPLVLALGFIVVVLRRRRDVRVGALVLVVVEVLALGRQLRVANHPLPVPLPWGLLGDVPPLRSALASRLALFASLIVAGLVVAGVSEWIRWSRAATANPRRRRLVNVALGSLLVASLALFQAKTPIVTTPVANLPSFFSDGEELAIPSNSVVLPFPLSVSPNALSMQWQVSTGFRWKMVGGEAIVATRRGTATGQPVADRPLPVSQFLTHWSGGAARLPVLDARLIVQMREYLLDNHVDTVLVDPAAVHATPAIALFRDTMGPPRREGGVDVWFHARALANAWRAREGPRAQRTGRFHSAIQRDRSFSMARSVPRKDFTRSSSSLSRWLAPVGAKG